MSDSESTIAADWPLCACGCGELASRAPTNNSRRGHVKGQPMKYKIGHSPAKPHTRPRYHKNGWRLCSCCGKNKRATLDNYSFNRTSPDGCHSVCKKCKAELARRDRAADPEKARAAARASYHRNKGDGLKARMAAAHKQGLKMAKDERPTAGDVRSAYEAQSGKCYYCGEVLDGVYEVEHKMPLSRGGEHVAGNICCACAACNRRKGTKTEQEFIDWLYRTQGLLSPL